MAGIYSVEIRTYGLMGSHVRGLPLSPDGLRSDRFSTVKGTVDCSSTLIACGPAARSPDLA